jgi:polyphosphate glucokinase
MRGSCHPPSGCQNAHVAGFGVDIGGSGIKGAPVDLATGTLTAERHRVETPRPAVPAAVLDGVSAVVEHFGWNGPLGVTFPGVVKGGVVHTAPNMHPDWVGVDLAAVAGAHFGQPVAALNDAGAAGLAEVAHGAAKDAAGVVVMLTFGTGVGCALFVDGTLVPNTELGHLELRGKDAEKRVAESVREAKGWSWKKWAGRVDEYLAMIERLLWPDLIVIGGGVAKEPEKFLPRLTTRAPVKVAALGNAAGIVGAAMAAQTSGGSSA